MFWLCGNGRRLLFFGEAFVISQKNPGNASQSEMAFCIQINIYFWCKQNQNKSCCCSDIIIIIIYNQVKNSYVFSSMCIYKKRETMKAIWHKKSFITLSISKNERERDVIYVYRYVVLSTVDIILPPPLTKNYITYYIIIDCDLCVMCWGWSCY